MLGELITLRTGPFGSSLHQSDYVEGGTPLVNPMHIIGGRIVPNTTHAVSDATLERLQDFRLEQSDVVIARRGEMGRCAVVTAREAGWLCGTGSMVIRCNPAVLPEYLQQVLGTREAVEFLGQESVGSTMANLNQKILLSLPIRLPPVKEQQRILDALDETIPSLQDAERELAAAKRKLTLYRQALLKSAVEGTLTADWLQRSLTSETGAQLLERISGGGVPASVPNQRVKELPRSWIMTTVRATGDVQLGRQRAPKFHAGDNMLPYLRVANVFEERIDTTDVMTMHFSAAEEANYLLEPGDILLNEGQSLELVGRPAMFRGELERVCFTNSLIRYRAAPGVEGEYALLVFLHYLHSGAFRALAPITTNIAHLGASRFAAMPFPLPPTAEQKEIVRRFGEFRSRITEQQAAINRALAMAAAQRQNILRAAFSGQLVPQDPNDEPASVLLERIRAQRPASATAAKRKPGRPAKVAA